MPSSSSFRSFRWSLVGARLLVISLGVSALALVPRTAAATPGFPDVIARELKLTAPPPCTICHAGGVTRRGTVTTPFGTSMRSRGLSAYDEGSLTTALTALTAEKKDSDEDGTGDIAELVAGSDPNAAAGDSLPPPDYGCSLAGAPRSTASVGERAEIALIGAAAFAIAVALRGRGRRRASCSDVSRRHRRPG